MFGNPIFVATQHAYICIMHAYFNSNASIFTVSASGLQIGVHLFLNYVLYEVNS
jgi:hypothetical protein